MSDTSVGRVALQVGLEGKSIQNQINSIGKQTASMAPKAFRGVGAAIGAAFVTKSVFDFGKAAVSVASNLTEAQNVVDTVFGKMSSRIDSFSKNALFSFGLSELSAKKFTSTMGAMLKSSKLLPKNVSDMSVSLTGLAGDMASFYNLSGEEAFNKLRAGISGETEPLKQLGINMSVANMEAFALSKGIKQSYSEMDQAAQTLLRYNFIMDATKDAQGDFAKTSGSWANQTRILQEQFVSFQAVMGQGFINMLTPVLRGLNMLIQKLIQAAQYFKMFTEVIFGAQKPVSSVSNSASSMSEEVANVGSSVKKAGKAVKGSLAAFDMLNVLSSTTADSMGEISDGAGAISDISAIGESGEVTAPDPTIFEPIKTQLESIKSLALDVGKYLMFAFGPPIQTALNQVMPVLDSWKISIGNAFTDVISLGKPLANWVTESLVPLWQQGIESFGTTAAGIYDSLLLIFEATWTSVFPIIEWFVTSGLELLTSFGSGAITVFDSMFSTAKLIFDTLFSGVISPTMGFISKVITDTLAIIKLTWDTHGLSLINGLVGVFESVKMLFSNLWNLYLKPIVTNMLTMLTWLWDSHLKSLVTKVGEFVVKVVNGATKLYNEFVAPLINWLIKNLGPAFSTTFSFIGDIFGTFLGVVSDVVGGVLTVLGGVIDFIVGVFTGDWEQAWNGVGDIIGGIFDGVVGIIKGAINLIIDAINFMIRNLNNIKVDIPDWVASVTGMKAGSFGFNLSTIPKLANGGLVSAPTLAMVGDNKNAKSDPEVVSPLSKLQDMLGISNQAVVEVLYMILSALQGLNLTVDIDGEKVSNLLKPYTDKENNRVGQSLITIGGVSI